jgi:anaerobic ribonucleoside-triphosphate reductase activating protein
LNYANIKKYDIANGPGIRLSLFVSGCRHHCLNCFNQEAWDFNYGKPFTEETENEILQELSKQPYKGMTLLGGEPMEPENQEVLAPFIEKYKQLYPDKTLWLFSGFTLEQLLEIAKKNPNTMRILKNVDVLVDGKFMEELKDISLLFRGSSNQRLIDLKTTLNNNNIVLWKDEHVSMMDVNH